MPALERLEQRALLTGPSYVGVFDGTSLHVGQNAQSVRLAQPGDQIVMGDWNGDGEETPGIFRGGNWILDLTGNGIDSSDKQISFGWATDKPVAGDWDGDGTDTVGVFRDGAWYFDHDGNGYTPGADDAAIYFGWSTDTPVPGDWNGDRSDTPGIFRDGTWVLDETGNGYTPDDRVIRFGLPGALPFSGDWNNDERDTPAVLQNNSFIFDDLGDGWNGFLNRQPEPVIPNRFGNGVPVGGNSLSPQLASGVVEANGRLVVRVRDAGNNALDDIRVSIRGSGISMSRPSDDDGIASFDHLPAGTYEVVAISPTQGESLVELVTLRTNQAVEFPLIRLPAVLLQINNQESGIAAGKLMSPVRFRYFIMGDDSRATSVRIEGRAVGALTWDAVVTENPTRIRSGRTLSFTPRITGQYEFRLVVDHGGRTYTSGAHLLSVVFASPSQEVIGRAILNDTAIRTAMNDAWKLTIDYAVNNPGWRREFGFGIYFNTGTGQYSVEPLVPGTEITGTAQGSATIVPAPDQRFLDNSPNGHMVYYTGSFHTHTPATYAPINFFRHTGPSSGDYDTLASQSSKFDNRQLVGIVHDYVGEKLDGWGTNSSRRYVHSRTNSRWVSSRSRPASKIDAATEFSIFWSETTLTSRRDRKVTLPGIR